MSESLPGPPHGASAAAAVLQRGGPEGGANCGEAAGSLGLMVLLLLLLEAVQRSGGGLCVGSCREEVHRVPPAVRVALVVVCAVTESWLQLLPQEAHSHLQDVGFLQLGVGLLLVELLLQDRLELLEASVDAISAHFLHEGFSQLWEKRQAGELMIQIQQ